jgi:hypothetical protein
MQHNADQTDPSDQAHLSPADDLRLRVEQMFQRYYFDTQGIPGASNLASLIDEAAFAKIFTKLAVGSATVWWSILELKDLISLYRSRKNKSSS